MKRHKKSDEQRRAVAIVTLSDFDRMVIKRRCQMMAGVLAAGNHSNNRFKSF